MESEWFDKLVAVETAIDRLATPILRYLLRVRSELEMEKVILDTSPGLDRHHSPIVYIPKEFTYGKQNPFSTFDLILNERLTDSILALHDINWRYGRDVCLGHSLSSE